MIDIRSVRICFSRKGGKLKNIDVRCPVCLVKAEVVQTVQEGDGLVYTLDCPKCGKTLARYRSQEELSAELKKAVGEWRM